MSERDGRKRRGVKEEDTWMRGREGGGKIEKRMDFHWERLGSSPVLSSFPQTELEGCGGAREWAL
jgi:hypothetical protein